MQCPELGDVGDEGELPSSAQPDMVDALTKKVAELEQGLATRDVIGQAKGILMERFKIDADAAFEWLRVASQHANRRVRDLADDLVRTGVWPHDRGARDRGSLPAD